MLRAAQLSVLLGELGGPVLYCFSSLSAAMARPRTPFLPHFYCPVM